MRKYFRYITLTLLAPLAITSCLKDNELIGPGADGSVANIIEFGNVSAPASNATSSIPLYSLSFDMNPTGVLNLKVKCVGAETAREDIRVAVNVNNALLETYNGENKTDFVAMPADQYALSSTEVIIKKGTREITLPINLKPSLFTFDHDYAIGLSIVSASSGVISGNFGNIILNLSGKNAYDGTYQYTTSANTSLVPNANKTVRLVTVGANRVLLSPGLLGTYSNEVYYNIDPVTFAVTVECPSLGVQTPQDTRSKYDPVSKKLTVFWKQGNGGRTFEETFTFTGPR